MCYLKTAQIEGASASFPIGSGFGHVWLRLLKCVQIENPIWRTEVFRVLSFFFIFFSTHPFYSQEWPINNFSPRYKYIVEQASGEKIRSIKIWPRYLSSKHQFLKCRTIPQESLLVSNEICHWDLVIEVKVVEWGRSNFAVVRSLVNVDFCDSKNIVWNTPAWLTDFHIHSF